MQRKRFILTKKYERFKKTPNPLRSKSRILCESGINKDYNNNCNKACEQAQRKKEDDRCQLNQFMFSQKLEN